MADQTLTTIDAKLVPECERQARTDAELLIPPAGGPTHSNAELHRAVRLLILSTTEDEKRIAVLYGYHRLPLAVVAQRVGVPEARACELFESLSIRERTAAKERRHNETLARFADRERAARKGKPNG